MKCYYCFLLATVAAVAFSAKAQAANILVNSGFGSPFIAANDEGIGRQGNTVEIPGIPGPIADLGWVVFANGGDGSVSGPTSKTAWEIIGGVPERTLQNGFAQFGIGQLVSNPGDGTFDNGDTVTFQMEYDGEFVETSTSPGGADPTTGGGSDGFFYRVYGMVHHGADTGSLGDPNEWDYSGLSNDFFSMKKPTDTNVAFSAIPGFGNYDVEELVSGTLGGGTSVVSGTETANILLGKDFDFFAVSVHADRDGTAESSGVATYARVDNVTLSGAAIPEPTSMVLVSLGLGALVTTRRRSC